jgi:DtxR family transcriptional regulator, Mn-dependent transcriptional regulator
MIALQNFAATMSSPLEDYLETVYLLVRDHGFARVKDIARARNVKPATISIALRKLAEGDLVKYTRREYIGLTPRGEAAARRIFARHRLLTRFFEEVLNMSPSAACDQACATEHTLTDEAMDRLVSFFESLGTCPSAIETFRNCQIGAFPAGKSPHETVPKECAKCARKRETNPLCLADLKPGQRGVVTHIASAGALRQRLLDMGILPETPIDLERSGLGGDPLWIRCQGARLALRKSEARTIRIRKEA